MVEYKNKESTIQFQYRRNLNCRPPRGREDSIFDFNEKTTISNVDQLQFENRFHFYCTI